MYAETWMMATRTTYCLCGAMIKITCTSEHELSMVMTTWWRGHQGNGHGMATQQLALDARRRNEYHGPAPVELAEAQQDRAERERLWAANTRLQLERDNWNITGVAAEAEAARLREARTLLSEVYNAFGSTWPQRYVEDVGAFLANSGQDAD